MTSKTRKFSMQCLYMLPNLHQKLCFVHIISCILIREGLRFCKRWPCSRLSYIIPEKLSKILSGISQTKALKFSKNSLKFPKILINFISYSAKSAIFAIKQRSQFRNYGEKTLLRSDAL